MEEACGSLERQFKRVCNDLEYVQHRLESEFRGGTSREGIPDVISLIKRIHHAEEKMNLLQSKASNLEIERSIVADEMVSLLLSNHNSVNVLHQELNKVPGYEIDVSEDVNIPKDDLLTSLRSCHFTTIKEH